MDETPPRSLLVRPPIAPRIVKGHSEALCRRQPKASGMPSPSPPNPSRASRVAREATLEWETGRFFTEGVA